MRFNLEKLNSQNVEAQKERKKQAVNSASEKITRLIEEDDFRITPHVKEKLEKVMEDTVDKYNGIEINSNQVLTNALEKIYEKHGGLINEELKNAYIDRIADEIVDMVAVGQEVHKAIGQKMIELKRANIKIDSVKVEEAVKSKI